MRLVSAASFYRMPFDEKAHIEDGSFINVRAGLFGVADGVSEAYSPSNPPRKYTGGLTGSQMVSILFCRGGASEGSFSSVEKFLLEVNQNVFVEHLNMGLDPVADDVGGASFAVYKLGQEISILLAGDCYVLVADAKEPLLYTGFDETGYEMEQKDQDAFTLCLGQANGNKGKAWDLYWPKYKEKRIFCANKNIGKGGYATLNGDPALESCWTKVTVEWTSSLEFILLLTDGLLPPSETCPGKQKILAQTLRSFTGREASLPLLNGEIGLKRRSRRSPISADGRKAPLWN